MAESVVEDFIKVEDEVTSFAEEVLPEEPPKKRQRKPPAPKKLNPETGEPAVPVVQAIKKRKARSEAPEDPEQPEEPKKKKLNKQEEHVLNWVKSNSKLLARKKKDYAFDLASLEKKLQDPNIRQSGLLPLCHFLGTTEILLHGVAEFDSPCVTTEDGCKLLEKMKKWKDEKEIDPDTLNKLCNKYGKTWWKLPRHDLGRVQKLFSTADKVRAILIDVSEITFADKFSGEDIKCLMPKFRYEIAE
jgi:hypothetical protein